MSFTTLIKGIEILNLFLKEKVPLTAMQVATTLKMPRSTTFKYLAILREQGLLQNEPLSGKYKLGFRLLEFGSVIQAQNPLLDVALPYLNKLSKLTEETVLLSALEDGVPKCLEIVEYKQGIGFRLHKGAELPMNGGASTKVLVAFLPEKEIQEYVKRVKFVRFAANTIMDAKEFVASLARIRKEGYAHTDEEVTPGASGLAAPIFSAAGRPVAGLCVVGPIQRMKEKKIKKVKSLITEFARDISAGLSKTK